MSTDLLPKPGVEQQAPSAEDLDAPRGVIIGCTVGLALWVIAMVALAVL